MNPMDVLSSDVRFNLSLETQKHSLDLKFKCMFMNNTCTSSHEVSFVQTKAMIYIAEFSREQYFTRSVYYDKNQTV